MASKQINIEKRTFFWVILFVIMLAPVAVLYFQAKEIQEMIASRRTNKIILVTIDTLRADRVGVYGHARAKTPNMDALAKKSTLFSSAFCHTPITNPSHCSLMTGMYPGSHGVKTNGYPLPEKHSVVAELLSRGGYKTAAFVSGFSLVDQVSGLARGFDVYDDAWSKTRVERKAPEATEAALDWLESAGDRFFLWIHYFDPHHPYAPPAPYNTFFRKPDPKVHEEAPAEAVEKWKKYAEKARENDFFNVIVKEERTVETTPEKLRDNLALYDGEISLVDSELGRFINALKDKGIYNDSLFILTSDHGEGFDHNYYYAHGDRLYDSSIHIPMMIKSQRKDITRFLIEAPVGTIDLFSTILNFGGVIIPKQNEGANLVDYMLGDKNDPYRDIYGYCPELNRPRMSLGQLRSLRNQQWKLIYRVKTNDFELYDMLQDPAELYNLEGSRVRIQNTLASKLLNRHERMALKPESTEMVVDERMIEGLKSLGYVD